MDYSCGKFGDCSFSRLDSTREQTDTQTDADERFTPATFVSVSSYMEGQNVGKEEYVTV